MHCPAITTKADGSGVGAEDAAVARFERIEADSVALVTFPASFHFAERCVIVTCTAGGFSMERRPGVHGATRKGRSQRPR